MGKTEDLFKIIRDTRGTYHAKLGSIKDRNGVIAYLLNGPEFDQTPGVGDRQGSLACCSPWGRKEPDTTW